MSEVSVTKNTDTSRWEAKINGELAGFADMRESGDRVVFTHTEVDPAFEGRGVCSALARTALDEVRSQGGKTVEPRCEFIAGWIEKHPEYADLLTA